MASDWFHILNKITEKLNIICYSTGKLYQVNC